MMNDDEENEKYFLPLSAPSLQITSKYVHLVRISISSMCNKYRSKISSFKYSNNLTAKNKNEQKKFAKPSLPPAFLVETLVEKFVQIFTQHRKSVMCQQRFPVLTGEKPFKRGKHCTVKSYNYGSGNNDLSQKYSRIIESVLNWKVSSWQWI